MNYFLTLEDGNTFLSMKTRNDKRLIVTTIFKKNFLTPEHPTVVRQ